MSGKVDEWVNAVIILIAPMNLPHDATTAEKMDAAEAVFEELNVPDDFVAEVGWEDASADR